MSLTMQHIISDAQSLCTRLKDHESLADRLIVQAQSLYKQVDAMKQYKEEVAELNDVAHQKPRDALVQGIQQENRHLRELQQENKELRSALEEHQNTLEVIMSKYRKQVTQLMQMNQSDRNVTRLAGQRLVAQSNQSALAGAQAEKIREMVEVMRRACSMEQQNEHAACERIAQLTEENRGLRELLRVGYSYNADLMAAAGPVPTSAAAGAAADCSGSTSAGSLCSLTVRRRPQQWNVSPESPLGQESGFQTVRRRLPTAAAAPPTMVVSEEEDTDCETDGSGGDVATADGAEGKVVTPLKDRVNAGEATEAKVKETGKGAERAAVSAKPAAQTAARTVPKMPSHSPPKPPSHSPPKAPVCPPAAAASAASPASAKSASKSPATSPKAPAQSPVNAASASPKTQTVPAPSAKSVSAPSKVASPPKVGSSPKAGSSPAKAGSSPPKRGSSPPKAGSSNQKAGSSPPKTRSSPPKRASSPPKAGSSPPKANSPPPKAGSPPPKASSSPLKAGSPPPKAGSSPPKASSSAPKKASSPKTNAASNSNSSPNSNRSSGAPTWSATPEQASTANGPSADDGKVILLSDDAGSDSDTSEASVVSRVERPT